MSDDFAQLLADLKDPEKYVVKPRRAIFDEHVDTYWLDPKTGEMVRPDTPGAKQVTKNFSREALEHIAAHNNARARHGDLAPLTFGHTIPQNPDERVQPTMHGYGVNFSVAFDPARKKNILYADYYIRKSDYPAATTYPFTSIELWPEDGTIHPISLLRRTPQRDLGQWVYGRAVGKDGLPSGRAIWRFSRAGQPVLRYSMESSSMPEQPWDADIGDATATPAPAAGDDLPNPGGEPGPSAGEAMQFMRHCLSHPHAKKYARHFAMDEAPPGTEPPLGPPDATMPLQQSATAASATNGDLPDDGPLQNRRPQNTGLAQYRRGGAPQSAAQRIEALEQRQAEAEAKLWVKQLGDSEGYELDEAREIQRFARLYRQGGDAACEDRAQEVRQYYRQRLTRPIGVPLAQPGRPIQNARQAEANLYERALQYQKQNKVSWDDALKAVQGNQVAVNGK